MTDARSIRLGPCVLWAGSTLGYSIFEAHRFAPPLAKCQLAGEAIWSIDDPANFEWKARLAMREAPAGYCPKCGVGWADFVNCDPANGCGWVDDPSRNPTFTVSHPNVNPITHGWQTGAEKADDPFANFTDIPINVPTTGWRS